MRRVASGSNDRLPPCLTAERQWSKYLLSARSSASVCLIVLTVYLLSSPLALADSEQVPAASSIGADGVRFKSDDEKLELRLRARIEGEFAIFGSNDALESRVGLLEDDAQFRRARIALQGAIGSRFHFKAGTDISDSDLSIETVYVGLRRLPHGLRVRAGHVKEPFAFEWTTLSRNGMFLERSVMSALRPSRNTGVLFNFAAPGGRSTFAAGLFRSIRGLEDYDVGKKPARAVTVRATALPWVDSRNNDRAIHIGVSYSQRRYLDGEVRLRAEPEIDLAPNFVDSGVLEASGGALFGLDFALLAGPWTLQAETIRASIDSHESDDPRFSGAYLALSWFVTGESRPYDRQTGRFGRLYPSRSFLAGNSERGPGAWEVVLRYSELDLNDGPIQAGALRGVTLGANWYLSPNVRILANVVHAERHDLGSVRIAALRFQMDF